MASVANDKLLRRNPSRKKHVEGELIFSRSGYSGVVLYVLDKTFGDDVIAYVIVWTISENDSWYFNIQVRPENTLRQDAA